VPIIVLTGNDDNNLALAAVKRGAQDYLVKGRLDRELLLRSMQYAIERKRYQLQLEHQANYDALTGLPNRTLLNDRLRQSVYGQRLRRAVAVVVIDLDHFKFVNSSLGHATGDRLLKAMAERLRGMLRDGDTVARLGGDEFVLILNDQSSEEVIYRAMQRIADELARPLEIDERVNERLALESALRRALERRELVLHYQSRVDLATGAISGAEALLRWLHPEWGLVRPARFVPLAEETGLIVPIGEFVLLEACRQTRAWIDAGLAPGLTSVNLSARQFREDGLVRKVSRVLEETGLHPQSLELELTESTVMHDVDAAIATLQGLKSLGVSLSVD